MNDKNQIVEARETPKAIAHPAPIPIGALLQQAIDKGISAESLERMVMLAERISDRAAREEFHAAMAAFQAECPAIPKTSTARFATRGGSEMRYNYADLTTVVGVVRPILQRHGLSFTWDTVYDGGRVTATCIVKHVNGHSERSSTSRPTESNSAASPQQKDSAAETTAMRRSLILALGLTTCDPDTDAGTMDTTPISQSQAADVEALIEAADADRARFLRHFGIADVPELPLSRLSEAVTLLEAKRRKVAP